MGEITIRKLDDATLAELRRRADHNGWSVEDELCSIVSKAVRPTREEVLRRVDELRDRIAPHGQGMGDAVEILREIREP